MQKKKCNAEEIQSVTNRGSKFEEEIKYRRTNAMQKKFTLLPIMEKISNAGAEMQYRRNSLLPINGHYLKKK